MRIDTVSEFSKLVADAKALCAEHGVSVKAKTLKPVLAETFGYPHENGLIAALPVESDLEPHDLAQRFVGLLKERVKPPLSATQAEPLFESLRKARVVWSPGPQDKLPLFAHYDGQLQPQPAFLSLDIRTGEVDAGFSGEISGVPSDVWHGLVRRYTVPAGVLSYKLEALLSDPDLLALLNRVLAGSETVWDGSNYVGRLTDDAKDAEDEIERYLEGNIDHADDCGTVESIGRYMADADLSLEDVIGDDWDLASAAESLRDEVWIETRTQIGESVDEIVDYLCDLADENDVDLDALLEANAKKTPPVIFVETPHQGDERAWIADNVWDAVERIGRELSRRDVDYSGWTFAQIIDENGADLSSYRVYYSPTDALKDAGEFDPNYPPLVIQELEKQGLLEYQLIGASGEPASPSYDNLDDALSWAEESDADVFVRDASGYEDDPERFCVWINPNCMVQ